MEKRIGFVGCYSHDVILLLARTLGCIGKNVLIRDRNKKCTLQASVPVPEGLRINKSVIEYDGFFYTRQSVGEERGDEYDVELIDFGMDTEGEMTELCNEFVIITDMLLHHIRGLVKTELPKESVGVCLIRDVTEGRQKGESEVENFFGRFPNRCVFYLPPDFRDVKNRYVCETMHEYSIRKASPELQDAIYQMVGRFYPEYTEKEIRRCVRRCERRRY